MAGVQGLPNHTLKKAMDLAQKREKILQQVQAAAKQHELDSMMEDMANESAKAATQGASPSTTDEPVDLDLSTTTASTAATSAQAPKNPNPVLRARPTPTVIPGFENNNTPWSSTDDAYLNEALSSSSTVYDMAIHLHRTESAVKMRLMKIGINILNTTGDVMSVEQVAKHIRVDVAEFKRFMHDFVKRNVGNEGQISVIRKLLDKRYERPSSTVVLEHPPPVINVTVDSGLLNFTASIHSRLENLEKMMMQIQRDVAQLIAEKSCCQPASAHWDNLGEAQVLEVLRSIEDQSDDGSETSNDSDSKHDDPGSDEEKSDEDQSDGEKSEKEESEDEDADEDEDDEDDNEDESGDESNDGSDEDESDNDESDEDKSDQDKSDQDNDSESEKSDDEPPPKKGRAPAKKK